MPDIANWIRRLDQVEARLAVQAGITGGLLNPDPESGERWERGQVWGHIGEFVPFWTEQVGDVIDQYEGEPVPYGRTVNDPGRRAGIENGLQAPVPLLWDEVRSDLAGLRSFLRALPEQWEEAVGLHPRSGPRSAEQIIEQTLIAHLEEHAAHLENAS